MGAGMERIEPHRLAQLRRGFLVLPGLLTGVGQLKTQRRSESVQPNCLLQKRQRWLELRAMDAGQASQVARRGGVLVK